MLNENKTHGTIIAEESARDPEFAQEWERTAVARLVAEQLIEYRADHKLSQKKLGELIGMKQPYITRLESGEHNPDIETLIKISRALGIEFLIDIAPREQATRKLVKKGVVEAYAAVDGARTAVVAAAARHGRRRAAA
jgi:transcriptional regulator with XRE-family HTH domain